MQGRASAQSYPAASLDASPYALHRLLYLGLSPVQNIYMQIWLCGSYMLIAVLMSMPSKAKPKANPNRTN